MERTLIILKPDCVQRRLLGRIVQRFEDKGLKITAMKLMRISGELAEQQYAPHKGKYFYAPLMEYITSGPVVVMVAEGPRAVDVCRKMMGKTFGFEAEPGSIRGDFGASTRYNLVHGSDSAETAEAEIALYFTPAEILDYDMHDAAIINIPGTELEVKLAAKDADARLSLGGRIGLKKGAAGGAYLLTELGWDILDLSFFGDVSLNLPLQNFEF